MSGVQNASQFRKVSTDDDRNLKGFLICFSGFWRTVGVVVLCRLSFLSLFFFFLLFICLIDFYSGLCMYVCIYLFFILLEYEMPNLDVHLSRDSQDREIYY